ncbi:MAG: hypothetical protein ACRD0A_08945 [Acidimicrobiales bacterium]
MSAIVVAGIANGLYRTLWAAGLPLLALTGVMSANLLFMSDGGRLATRPAGCEPDAGVADDRFEHRYHTANGIASITCGPATVAGFRWCSCTAGPSSG